MEDYVTIKDIAEKTGFSVSTVSRVLTQKGRISAATRALVQKVATELNYHPDPHLAILSEYRKSKARKTFRGLIAFLIPESFPEADSKNSIHTQQAIQGAQSEAERIGYQLEEILCPTDLEGKGALFKTLHHRGFEGLIFIHENWPNPLCDFKQYQFAAVNIMSNSSNTIFPNIQNHIDFTMVQCLKKMKAAGYKKTGLITIYFKNKIQNLEMIKTYFFDQGLQPFSKKMPMLAIGENIAPKLVLSTVGDWMKENHYDSFIFQGSEWLCDSLLEQGFFKDFKKAGLSIDILSPQSASSGFYHNRENLGRASVREIHSQISLQQPLTEKEAKQIFLPQKWKEGRTFPQLNSE